MGLLAAAWTGCSQSKSGDEAGAKPRAERESRAAAGSADVKPAAHVEPGASAGRRRVLILCTGNSCRSQMAEGFWRQRGGDAWEAFSAGSKPSGRVHPTAVQVMAERGVDISGGRSKSVREFAGQHFDLVITVCDDAAQNCPVFPNASARLHWPFDDPPKATGTDEEKLAVFRRVRDEIDETIRRYLAGERDAHQRVAAARDGADGAASRD